MKKIIILSILSCIHFMGYAQGRKDIKNAGITSETVYKFEYKTGKEVKTVDAKIIYDANGNETEVYEYDDYGKVKRHEKYSYNASNDKISQVEYDASGKIKKMFKYTYDANGKRATESEYDSSGNLKKLSKYNYYGEFKTEKLTFDATNKLIQKKVYTYDK